jgi:hypothetical protein
MIGQYVGQTGPKTIKQLERGLGKVLFIDEAYRLSEGLFAQEAVNELVDTMTKPKFAGKMVIILAGYDNDMNNLLRVNEGLSSRFADEVIFLSLSPEHCLQLLEARLNQSRITIPSLQDSLTRGEFVSRIAELSKFPSWGNARDIQTLAKSMVHVFYQTNTTKADTSLSKENAMSCIQSMLADRQSRNAVPSQATTQYPGIAQLMDPLTRPPPSIQTSTEVRTTSEASKKEEMGPELVGDPVTADTTRDAGVPDTIWTQLEKDKETAALQIQILEKRIREQEEVCRIAEEAEKKRIAETIALQEIQAKNEAENLELLRRREEARIREMEAKAEKERIQQELERAKQQELGRKRLEQQAQVKLRHLGVCPVGYQWIKQSGGYRCAAGSHFVTNDQLGM